MIRKHIPALERKTLEKHLQQQNVPTELASVLIAISRSAKAIRATIEAAGLNDILGSFGEINVQGEEQQKLDVYADQVMLQDLAECECVGIVASEERAEPVVFERESGTADYALSLIHI